MKTTGWLSKPFCCAVNVSYKFLFKFSFVNRYRKFPAFGTAVVSEPIVSFFFIL